MSTDNWTKCPKCKIRETKKYERLVESLQTKYGKVEPDEYLALVKQVSKGVQLDDNLREDYEVGIRDGEFCVRYTCRCTECKFSFEYNYTQEQFE